MITSDHNQRLANLEQRIEQLEKSNHLGAERFEVGQIVWCWGRRMWGVIEEIDPLLQHSFLVNFFGVRRGYHSADEITTNPAIPPKPTYHL